MLPRTPNHLDPLKQRRRRWRVAGNVVEVFAHPSARDVVHAVRRVSCLLHSFGGQLVYIIPRRDFASPELEETFHRLLRTKLGDAALR
jgi:hypothetical protein